MMKSKIPVLAAAMACATAVGGAQSLAAPLSQAASQDQAAAIRLTVFDQVWGDIDRHYYDPGFNGVDWKALGARYRPLAAAAATDAEFHRLLRAMTGELRDAHTRVLGVRQSRDKAAGRSVSAGVHLFEVEGRAVVFGVLPGSPAAEANLRRGLRVIEVNGVPIAEALREARAEIGPSSSERASRVLSYLRLISGPPEQRLRLRLVGEDGAPFEVQLPRRPLSAAPRFESRILPTGHLYVKFDRFRAPVAKLFAAALARSPHAPGLILDLRSNIGGDGKEGTKAIGPLLAAPTLVARLATRTGKAPSALGGLVKLPLRLMAGKAGGQIYGGPVAILTNEATGSTSEVIAASLQERGRAIVVGTRSCGCALGVLKHRKLKDGSTLAISEIGLLSGLGRRIEGQGVVPDVAVQPSFAEFAQGRDLVLEAAVYRLSQ